jgi:hypothetical protein
MTVSQLHFALARAKRRRFALVSLPKRFPGKPRTDRIGVPLLFAAFFAALVTVVR